MIPGKRVTVTRIDSTALPVTFSAAIFPQHTGDVAMSKLSVVLLSATLSLFATGSFAAVSASQLNQPVQHAQAGTLKQDAAKASKKHVKKKTVRKAKRKAVRAMVK